RVVHLLPAPQDRQPHRARPRRRARRPAAPDPHQARRRLPPAPAADGDMTTGPDRTTTGSRPVPPPPPPPPGSRGGGPAPSGTGSVAPAAATPAGPGDGGPTAERPFGRPVPTEGWGWFARVPLRARLVAITVLLLAAGLGLASAVTTTVVSSYLVGQVDSQLRTSAGGIGASL